MAAAAGEGGEFDGPCCGPEKCRRSQTDKFCPKPIWTRLMLSTPPTKASAARLPDIPAASNAPTMLVVHCMMVVNVGTCGSSLLSSQTSRARLA